jgi:small-conductance mechanosensitive channel
MTSKHRTALFFLLLLLLLTACGADQFIQTFVETEEQNAVNATLEAAGVIEIRTPQPTATPGILSNTVDELTTAANIEDLRFLGLAAEDWINLGISLIIVFLGYLVGSWAIRILNRYAARFLSEDKSKVLFKKAGHDLVWLAVFFALNLATVRLTFLNAAIKAGLQNIYFVIGTLFLTRAFWYLIDVVDLEVRAHLRKTGREENLSPAIVLSVRILRVLLILISGSVILSHFGINMTAFAALLGIGGLAFSLAARDTIEDAIAGVIILIDQPFRIGDRIEISAASTWGDVVDIGLRTTRIRTRDNRLVIIPNSLIAQNEVINYTYPDPTYRIQTEVGLDYNTDVERARQVMSDAVRKVPNVLKDKPVDVLYSEMGDSTMVFIIRWWIETYADTRRVTDEVNTALQAALDAAGIKSPYPSQRIYLHNEPSDSN